MQTAQTGGVAPPDARFAKNLGMSFTTSTYLEVWLSYVDVVDVEKVEFTEGYLACFCPRNLAGWSLGYQ
jgi:hypothetical protein